MAIVIFPLQGAPLLYGVAQLVAAVLGHFFATKSGGCLQAQLQVAGLGLPVAWPTYGRSQWSRKVQRARYPELARRFGQQGDHEGGYAALFDGASYQADGPVAVASSRREYCEGHLVGEIQREHDALIDSRSLGDNLDTNRDAHYRALIRHGKIREK